MFSFIAQGAVSKFNRVLVISHRIELLTQAGGTFSQFGLNPQLITAETKHPPKGAVYAAMTGTLKNRLQKQEWIDWWSKIDIIIVDEAHRSDFNWLLDYDQGKIKLGFTATAKRSGKMPQLASEYDKMVNEVDVQDLISMGFLLPDRYFGVPVDITGVKKDNNGEYNNSQLYDKFASKTVYEGLASNILKHAPNEQTICFCVNIRHCIETTIMLNEHGISAKFVTSAVAKPQVPSSDDIALNKAYNSKLKDYNFYNDNYHQYSGDRDTVTKQWKRREFDVLINAGIFVEGFDEPSTTCVIINMATTSANKWLQMVGRGSRLSEGKRFFKLFDFGNNAERLGHYRAQREFSLLHSSSEGSGVAASKLCKNCNALCIVSARICKYCGHEFPSEKEIREIELMEMKWDDPLELKTELNGNSKKWLWRQIWLRDGDNGLIEYGRKKGFHKDWSKRLIKIYAN